MKESKSTKLTFIVVLAAVVAAATTLILLLLRARSKKRALHAYNDALDYDLDDCCCDDCCCDCEDEAPADAEVHDAPSSEEE